MKCPYCGYDNPDNAHFCSGCGKRMDARQDIRNRDGYGDDTYRQRRDPVEHRDEYEDNYEERRHQREERRRERQRREEKKIILIGVALACVVVVAGIGAYFGITHFLNGDADSPVSGNSHVAETWDSSSAGSEATETVTPTPEATETPAPTPAETATPTPTPTPSEEPEQLTVSLTDRNSVSLSGYSRAEVSRAAASSTVVQEGYDNSANMAVDGDVITSWQEGADGDGIGEVLQFTLDREYDVKYMTFHLGNWRDAEKYSQNNRPQTMTIWLDDMSFQVTFPDGQTEFCLEFSSGCPASEIYVRIDSVYEGTEWDDTCISEIGIYGN